MNLNDYKQLKIGDKFTNVELIERDGLRFSMIPIGTIFEIYAITGNTTIHYRYTINEEIRCGAFMLKSINADKCVMLREYNLDKLGII